MNNIVKISVSNVVPSTVNDARWQSCGDTSASYTLSSKYIADVLLD